MGKRSQAVAAWPARVNKQTARNADDAAELIVKELKVTVGDQYPPASRPGEAPARRVGILQASAYALVSIKSNPNTVTIRMGFTAPYWRHLAPTRPAIEITLARIGPSLKALLFRSI